MAVRVRILAGCVLALVAACGADRANVTLGGNDASRSANVASASATGSGSASAGSLTSVAPETSTNPGTSSIGGPDTSSDPVPPTDPSSTTTTLAPLALAGTGVRGTVTESPTCPGAVRPGQNCTAPVSVRIDAHDSTGAVAGSTTSLDDGRYALALPPGSYTLVVDTAQSGPFSCPSTDVTITDGAPASADIDCDTGIR